MIIYTPYTYRVTFIPTRKHYYGVRYANGCSPSDLFVSYFTSSNEIKQLIENHGVECFEYEVRKTFTNKEEAMQWETKVLRRLNVVSNVNWINKSIPGSSPYFYRTKGTKDKDPISKYRRAESHKGLIWIHNKQLNEERLIRKTDTLDIHWEYGRIGSHYHNRLHSKEAIEKIRKSALNRPQFYCDCCCRTIKGKQNWDRHLKSNRHLSQTPQTKS